MEIVAVDVGGTHARFAVARDEGDGIITLEGVEILHTGDHASFQAAWEEYRRRRGGTLPRAVSMAVAGPVNRHEIRFTNNPWIIRPALVTGELGVDRVTIVNDFAAVAHAVARAPEAQFVHLAGPETPLPPTGLLTVIGPGTGLGVAHLYREAGGAYRVSATEGGHVDFAPLDPIDDAILARLRKRYKRVSAERVVAGPAISDIYMTLAALEGREVVEGNDVAIWARGMDGSDNLAAAAVDRFCMALGSVAGDMALAHGAHGVVIAGGLGLRIRDSLRQSAFAERFCAKGRFAPMMASIPIKLIIHPQPGLYGAAAAYLSEHA